MRCKVCDHDGISAINSLLTTATLSNRRIASQYGFSEAAVRRHKDNHLPVTLVRAAERKQIKAEDVFMQRHEDLYRESRQYVEDAKGAVKYQKTGPEEYTAFRDVGAMAPALGAATALQRVLGDATGRFAQAPTSVTNQYLSVIMPRTIDGSLGSVAGSNQAERIEASSDPVIDVIPDTTTE